MADLNACYFCGDGVDATVEEYPVVPPTLDPPDGVQRTVALCPDCRRKLGAVLEHVVDYAVETAGTPTTGESDRERGDPGQGDSEDGVRFERPDEGAGADPVFGTGSAPLPDDASPGSAPPPDDAPTGPGAGPTDAGAGTGGPAPVPDSFGKVVRLLQNREFPVDRAEFEAVAANAYELSPGECSRSIDAAVERGLVVDDGGTLRRPE